MELVSVPGLILALVTLVIGGGTGGFYVQARKDRRLERVDDADLTERVRAIAAQELDRQEKRSKRLEARCDQLTEVLRTNGMPVPPWPPVEE